MGSWEKTPWKDILNCPKCYLKGTVTLEVRRTESDSIGQANLLVLHVFDCQLGDSVRTNYKGFRRKGNRFVKDPCYLSREEFPDIYEEYKGALENPPRWVPGAWSGPTHRGSSDG